MMKLSSSLFLVFYLSVGWAGDWSGYAKFYPIHFDSSNLSGQVLTSSFRAGWNGEIAEDVDFGFHYELTPIVSKLGSYNSAGAVSESYRVDDVKPSLYKERDFDVQQNLDRTFVKYRMESVDIIAGRQPIAFGSGRIANPTDVFLPYSLQSINTEYRRGIDAIRVQYALGTFTELDFGVVAGRDTNGFLRFRSQYSETDFAFILARFQNRTMGGLSLQSSWQDYGIWFEIAQVLKHAAEPSYNRWNLGWDRMIGETTTMFCELHFNGPGSSKRTEYTTVTSQFAYQSGSVFLLGQNYVAPGVGWALTDLTSLRHSFFLNLDDESVLFSNSLESSLNDDLYFEAGASIGFGDKTSEFGLITDIYHLGVKSYF